MRSQKGLTRKDLAEITGISYPTLQLYEQKRSSIDKMTLWNAMLISKALGCEAWELLDDCPYYKI
ncbi:helix-turn-helix domain-containing protein [Butyrivibrio sp. WCE2006]|uniref:helix-turn-helix domain-containing protein n=1 Tax=Butyrivibrio sp. WCE2006 TaxID=1410611 RepID=UPI003FA40FC8